MGSKRQVDGLAEQIIEVSSDKSTGEKQSKYMSGFTAVTKVPVFGERTVPVEGRRWLILSLIVRILSLKKLIKSLLLRAIGIHGSVEL